MADGFPYRMTALSCAADLQVTEMLRDARMAVITGRAAAWEARTQGLLWVDRETLQSSNSALRYQRSAFGRCNVAVRQMANIDFVSEPTHRITTWHWVWAAGGPLDRPASLSHIGIGGLLDQQTQDPFRPRPAKTPVFEPPVNFSLPKRNQPQPT